MKSQRNVSHTALIFSSIFFFLFLFGANANASTESMLFLSFGGGKTEVRLYSDYFCGACRTLEPKIEPLLIDLVKKNIISVTFIDAPFHQYSSLYAKAFLYILNEKKVLRNALKARSALFEASKEQITEDNKLEVYMRSKGFPYKVFDPKPVLGTLASYLQEDNINSTPTCIIITGRKKDIFIGTDNIVNALQKLK